MSGLTFKTFTGSNTTLDPSVAKDLAKSIQGEILTASEMRAVVARRDVVKKHVEELVAVYGEPAVLAFP